jgi:hypothetical protein
LTCGEDRRGSIRTCELIQLPKSIDPRPRGRAAPRESRGVGITSTMEEAVEKQEWKDAMMEEYQSIMKNDV